MWDDYEEEFSEPETSYKIKDGAGKATVDVGFNIEELEIAFDKILERHIEANLVPHIERKVRAYCNKNWGVDDSIAGLIEKKVTQKLDEIYPDIVENKANELAEKIKKMEVNDRRNSFHGDSIHNAARKKVDDYIEKELKNEVKKTTEYLEQFSRNYFANNLFKAMGMMDKMIPETLKDK